MRTSRVSSEEQFRMVMECRSSGLTDYQWCLEHGIKPGTFYNWVGGSEKTGIPTSLHHRDHTATRGRRL